MTADRLPLADDIPLDRAWRTGRRVYVRCGYHSRLNTQLRGLGAHWDGEARALWTGSGKRTQVAELVRAAEARRTEIDRIKAAGRWVTVPRGAADLRARIKDELGGVFDGDRKQWALPTDEALTRARQMVADHQEAAAADRADRRRRRAAEAAETLPDRIARLTAEAGRTLTGGPVPGSGPDGTVTLTTRLFQRMRRAEAQACASGIGEVIRDEHRHRFLIIGRDLEFWNQDMVDDQAPHLVDPHWLVTYTCVRVETTPDEAAADRAADAEAADAAEIDDLMRQAGTVTAAATAIAAPYPPEQEITATITGRAGHTGTVGTGTLILTRDGRVHWRHPGYYDDYIPTAGTTTDPAFTGRVRALTAAGSRTLQSRRGQLPATYTITVTAPEGDQRA